MDWTNYYEKASKGLVEDIENDFDKWVNHTIDEYSARYVLICNIMTVKNDWNKKLSGEVTHHIRLSASSHTIGELCDFYHSDFIKSKLNSTYQHFIVDIKERKVVKILSICA